MAACGVVRYVAGAVPVEFLTDEQVAAYGAFVDVPTRAELERFFFLDDEDRRPRRSLMPPACLKTRHKARFCDVDSGHGF